MSHITTNVDCFVTTGFEKQVTEFLLVSQSLITWMQIKTNNKTELLILSILAAPMCELICQLPQDNPLQQIYIQLPSACRIRTAKFLQRFLILFPASPFQIWIHVKVVAYGEMLLCISSRHLSHQYCLLHFQLLEFYILCSILTSSQKHNLSCLPLQPLAINGEVYVLLLATMVRFPFFQVHSA